MLRSIVQVRCRIMRSRHGEPGGQGKSKLTAVAQGITKHQGGDIRGAFEGGGENRLEKGGEES